MATVALFHSVLGVRPGVLDAAERLRNAGHEVRVVDQYGGRVFDDYPPAMEYAEAIGYPALMGAAADAVGDLPEPFVTAGFSNGGGMAEYVALHRRVSGVVMLSGALPISLLGASDWPSGVDAQIHHTVDDTFRKQESIDAVAAAVREAGGGIDVFDYPGAGHLFTDASLPAEYDPDTTRLLWERVLEFCGRH